MGGLIASAWLDEQGAFRPSGRRLNGAMWLNPEGRTASGSALSNLTLDDLVPEPCLTPAGSMNPALTPDALANRGMLKP
ncbi:MAG: hypothetical protein ACREN7_01675, partial [Candidatus Dormibacteria bacterium]